MKFCRINLWVLGISVHILTLIPVQIKTVFLVWVVAVVLFVFFREMH